MWYILAAPPASSARRLVPAALACRCVWCLRQGSWNLTKSNKRMWCLVGSSLGQWRQQLPLAVLACRRMWCLRANMHSDVVQ